MKKLTKAQSWGIVIAVFALLLLGYIGGKTETKTEIREVPKETIRTVEKKVEVEVCPNEATWKELKAVDDRIISVAAESMTLCSEGFSAISELDVNRMENVVEELGVLTPRMEQLTTERLELLGKLGY